MIDVMENKVLGPMIEERLKQEFDQGLNQGKKQLLRDQLNGQVRIPLALGRKAADGRFRRRS